MGRGEFRFLTGRAGRLWIACVVCVLSASHAVHADTGHEARISKAPTRVATRAKAPAAARAERLGLGTLRAAGKCLAGAPDERWIPGQGSRGPLFGTLRFPVPNGAMSRGFGSGAGSYHQAMDIMAKVGTKVHASAAGIVAYAGDEVRGYGNLILLVHEGGAVTAYAHNQRNLVVPGQRVDRGTLIALLGSTGRSKGPHVHFELLFGGENCDPGPLFRPGVRTPKGESAGYVLSAWRNPKRRPKAVRCAARKHHPDTIRAQADEDDEGA